MSQTSKSPVRLVVTTETSTAVDNAVPEVGYLAKRRVSKADITNAAIKIGLRDLRAVAAVIAGEDEPADLLPGDSHQPEHPPVVAAIVTSERGVLVGRRHDKTPEWTFIAGKVESGESTADAAVREVKEETGLRVVAAEREIGRRVHPKTGRTMIYLACGPTSGTEVFVGDPDELSEVRWVSLAEAERLLPGMFEPVHRYLIDHLQEGGPTHE